MARCTSPAVGINVRTGSEPSKNLCGLQKLVLMSPIVPNKHKKWTNSSNTADAKSSVFVSHQVDWFNAKRSSRSHSTARGINSLFSPYHCLPTSHIQD